ncbi:MAG: RusA family crossover junction endodeoxyribonuclease [Candidatus Obscuribacterales bacterium]|nr:RusA family crossover junction endodeoxyribonuclease [Candidatus Obscuribacterales bacterium]
MDWWDEFERRQRDKRLDQDYNMPLGPQPWQRINPKSGQNQLKTRRYEEIVATLAEEEEYKRNLHPRLSLEVLFLSTKKVGDLSNCIKSLEDALNRISYHDDRQIDHLNALRLYAPSYPERTLVRISELAS